MVTGIGGGVGGGVGGGGGGGGIESPHVLAPKKHFYRCMIYLTIPVTSATSERTFSALRRLKNYLRSTKK